MGRRRLAAGHVPKQVPNLMRKKKCEPFLQKLPLFTGHIRIWFAFLECSHLMLIFAMPLMILLVLNCSTKVSEKSDMAKS